MELAKVKSWCKKNGFELTEGKEGTNPFMVIKPNDRLTFKVHQREFNRGYGNAVKIILFIFKDGQAVKLPYLTDLSQRDAIQRMERQISLLSQEVIAH